MRPGPIFPAAPHQYDHAWAQQLLEALSRAFDDHRVQLLDSAFPIETIYANNSDDRNPALIIGRGEWELHPGGEFAPQAWRRIA